RGVHPHVERTWLLVAEAAIRVVDLHRRHAEVHEDDVRGRESFGRKHLRQTGEVPVPRDEGLRTESGGAQTGFRARQLERIHVEADQASSRLDAFEDRLRVTAAAKRAVNGNV